MYKTVEISSPGKLILCGEHSVVYGKKALACSINLRTKLIATLSTAADQAFELVLADLDNKTVIIDENEFNLTKHRFKQHNTVISPDAVFSHLVSLRPDAYIDKPLESIQLMILLTDMQWTDLSHYKVNVTSELPLGAGLGSSASFSTCLASFFLTIARRMQLDDQQQFTLTDLELINSHAFQIERIFHGKPSGIDNSIATHGRFLVFEKGSIGEMFTSPTDLDVLIVNSNVSKKTVMQVEKVRGLYQRHDAVLNQVMSSIDCLVEKFISILKEKKRDGDGDDSVQKLRELITINQGLLYALHVTSEALDRIVSLAQSCGFSAKVTGSGGGGCCYVLLNSMQDKSFEDLIHKLDLNGFTHFKTELGCPGVRLDVLER
jgi:mevalonate kinase